MNEQEFAELAAGHVLHALSPEDERAFTAALAARPEWDALVAADEEAAAILGNAVPEVAPPLGARGALLSQILRTPQNDGASQEADRPNTAIDPLGRYAGVVPPHPAPPLPDSSLPGTKPQPEPVPEVEQSDPTISFLIPGIHDREAPSEAETRDVEPPPTTDVVQTVARGKWMRGMFALAASVVLLVALGFGAALVGQQIGRSPAVVALDRISGASDAQVASATVDGGGEATAHWSQSLGEAVIVADGIPTLAADQTYQLWFVRDGAPVSAGLFEASAQGDTTTLLDGAMHTGDTIAVTVEPAGGSAEPTTTPIVAIPTA